MAVHKGGTRTSDRKDMEMDDIWTVDEVSYHMFHESLVRFAALSTIFQSFLPPLFADVGRCCWLSLAGACFSTLR